MSDRKNIRDLRHKIRDYEIMALLCWLSIIGVPIAIYLLFEINKLDREIDRIVYDD